MKKETRNSIKLLRSMMIKQGMEKNNIELILRNEKGYLAAYTTYRSIIDQYDEPIYMNEFEYADKINEDNPCVWLASLLDIGFEIIYCVMDCHCTIWKMYDDCYDNIESYEHGLQKYFRYCKQNYISSKMLEAYSGIAFDDMADMEFFEEVHGYTILRRLTIDEQAFLFGIHEETGSFAVYDSTSDYMEYTNEISYPSYLEAFHNFQERIRKCCYDKMRAFNEEYFFSCNGDKEITSIMNEKKS